MPGLKLGVRVKLKDIVQCGQNGQLLTYWACTSVMFCWSSIYTWCLQCSCKVFFYLHVFHCQQSDHGKIICKLCQDSF